MITKRMKRGTFFGLSHGPLVGATLLAAGCVGTDSADPNSSPATLQASAGDLTVGARGDDVRRVHEYLTQFGYFPNADLEQRYPRWRPIVPQPPAAGDVYDEHTAQAVRALQAQAGLSQTGIVDDRTRALLAAPRCGVPDGIAPLDPSDKFALNGLVRNSSLSYALANTPTGVDPNAALDQVLSAASEWMNASHNYLFLFDTSGSAGVTISFGPLAKGIIGTTTSDGTTITFNSAFVWSAATPTPSGHMDIQSEVLHEMGHALGLAHSSLSDAVMYPFFGNAEEKRATTADDRVAIGLHYTGWSSFPGAARDIGIGANNGVGPSFNDGIWVIGTDPIGNDFGIFKWNNVTNQWNQDQFGAATRIAVYPDGRPLAVTSNGDVWIRSNSDPFSGQWFAIAAPSITSFSGAIDVGAGSDGSIWAIGNGAVDSGGDCPIFKWDPTLGGDGGWLQDQSGGAALRIAVGPDGRPWVVNSLGDVWRRQTSDPSVGSWDKLPLAVFGAADIGIDEGNYAWVVTRDSILGGGGLPAVWNEQAAIAGPSGSNATAESQWVIPNLVPSDHLDAIAVGANGMPFAVGGGGTIWAH